MGSCLFKLMSKEGSTRSGIFSFERRKMGMGERTYTPDGVMIHGVKGGVFVIPGPATDTWGRNVCVIRVYHTGSGFPGVRVFLIDGILELSHKPVK